MHGNPPLIDHFARTVQDVLVPPAKLYTKKVTRVMHKACGPSAPLHLSSFTPNCVTFLPSSPTYTQPLAQSHHLSEHSLIAFAWTYQLHGASEA